MKKRYIELLVILTILMPIFVISTTISFDKSQLRYSSILTNQVVPPTEPGPLIYGTKDDPIRLDPVNDWSKSLEIIVDQVAETLFTYDLIDPNMQLIPLLATGYDLEPTEKLNYTIYLRSGVTFHDGSEFNSTVVKWNFDRMEYWWNFTGSLPGYETIGRPYMVFYWEDEILPMWNRTEIIDENTIKFILNKPHSGFIHLLTRYNTAILSMESTPFYSTLTLGTDQIIGTGPFVYDHHISSTETKFYAFDNYWRGMAQIEELLFYYSDQTILNYAMFAGDIDFLGEPLPSMLDSFKALPDLTVIDDGETDSTIRYLQFNHNYLSPTVRKALSYAINYTENIDVLRAGTSNRLKTPIPPGITFSNSTLNYPYLNITKARQFMQSIGHGALLDPTYPGLNESDWEGLADTGAYNFSMWTRGPVDSYRNNLFDSCYETFRKTGINVYKEEIDYSEFVDNLDLLDMWMLGFLADYNYPSNYINYLFSNKSLGNIAGINDSYLQNLIELGTMEHNPVLSEGIYDEIQRYLVENLMPMAWLDVPKMYHVFNNDLTGFSQNVMERMFFYDYEWDPYNYEFTMTRPDDVSFTKGSTGNNITWTITATSVQNPYYNLHINNSFDTSDSWQSNVPVIINLDTIPVGSYAYTIEVHNGGYINLDTVIVTVEPSGADVIPGYSIFFIMGISIALITSIYKKIRKNLNP
ncbi:MAG: ABC transporter substrate-binding protein [Candidatus Hermodarchaeota archaeon]